VGEAHFGVVVSNKDALTSNPRQWQAIMISTELSYDDVFVVDVPSYLGLTGKFICSWFPTVSWDETTELRGLLTAGDFDRVVAQANEYQRGRYSYGHDELIRRTREARRRPS
jgi:hypothetical protein